LRSLDLQVMPSLEFTPQQALQAQLAAISNNDEPWCARVVSARQLHQACATKQFAGSCYGALFNRGWPAAILIELPNVCLLLQLKLTAVYSTAFAELHNLMPIGLLTAAAAAADDFAGAQGEPRGADDV
jgi:hypothetical protein